MPTKLRHIGEVATLDGDVLRLPAGGFRAADDESPAAMRWSSLLARSKRVEGFTPEAAEENPIG